MIRKTSDNASRRHYKVITCVVGVSLVLVTLLCCGMNNRRRLEDSSISKDDALEAAWNDTHKEAPAQTVAMSTLAKLDTTRSLTGSRERFNDFKRKFEGLKRDLAQFDWLKEHVETSDVQVVDFGSPDFKQVKKATFTYRYTDADATTLRELKQLYDVLLNIGEQIEKDEIASGADDTLNKEYNVLERELLSMRDPRYIKFERDDGEKMVVSIVTHDTLGNLIRKPIDIPTFERYLKNRGDKTYSRRYGKPGKWFSRSTESNSDFLTDQVEYEFIPKQLREDQTEKCLCSFRTKRQTNGHRKQIDGTGMCLKHFQCEAYTHCLK